MPKAKKTSPVYTKSKRLSRSKTDRVIAGVCGGLGEYFDIDPVIIRALFALFVVTGGSGVFVYIILWVILPESGDTSSNTETVVKKNSKEIEAKAKEFAKDVEGVANSSNAKIWLGLIVIFFGLWVTLSNFGFFNLGWYLAKLWPLLIIALGVLILVKRSDE